MYCATPPQRLEQAVQRGARHLQRQAQLPGRQVVLHQLQFHLLARAAQQHAVDGRAGQRLVLRARRQAGGNQVHRGPGQEGQLLRRGARQGVVEHLARHVDHGACAGRLAARRRRGNAARPLCPPATRPSSATGWSASAPARCRARRLTPRPSCRRGVSGAGRRLHRAAGRQEQQRCKAPHGPPRAGELPRHAAGHWRGTTRAPMPLPSR